MWIIVNVVVFLIILKRPKMKEMPHCNLFVGNHNKTFKNDLAICKVDDLWWKMFLYLLPKLMYRIKISIIIYHTYEISKTPKTNQNVFNINCRTLFEVHFDLTKIISQINYPYLLAHTIFFQITSPTSLNQKYVGGYAICSCYYLPQNDLWTSLNES